MIVSELLTSVPVVGNGRLITWECWGAASSLRPLFGPFPRFKRDVFAFSFLFFNLLLPLCIWLHVDGSLVSRCFIKTLSWDPRSWLTANRACATVSEVRTALLFFYSSAAVDLLLWCVWTIMVAKKILFIRKRHFKCSKPFTSAEPFKSSCIFVILAYDIFYI